MFVHMSVHKPRVGKEALLIDSMHRFGKAMEGRPGLQRAHVLKDQRTGHLIGLAIWDNQESWQASRPAMEEAVKNDDFESWEEEPPAVYQLEAV